MTEFEKEHFYKKCDTLRSAALHYTEMIERYNFEVVMLNNLKQTKTDTREQFLLLQDMIAKQNERRIAITDKYNDSVNEYNQNLEEVLLLKKKYGF